MSETKNDTKARAKREIAEEHPYPLSLLSDMPLRLYSALVAERVKNLELRQVLEALPLDKFGEDMATADAADFMDNSAAFFEAMTLARGALKRTEQRERVETEACYCCRESGCQDGCRCSHLGKRDA